MDNSERELAVLAVQLHGGGITTSVRGSGACRFVFAECGPRAVELYRDGQAWRVEFWDGDAVDADRTFAAGEEAVLAARVWLSVTE